MASAPEKSKNGSKPVTKHAKQLEKAYAKQMNRTVPKGQLPSPESGIRIEDYTSFVFHLQASKRILVLIGAGLSASSGIPTFRGAGGYWREHDATTLATPEAFDSDPALVWQFYNYRRHCVLRAKPNRAHVALAKLARFRKEEDYLAISQNIDGLSQRVGHPEANIELIHGSLFDIKCSSKICDYYDKDNFSETIVPALSIPEDQDISNAKFPLEDVPVADLPHCPKCSSLLRPAVVWFGESLPMSTINSIHDWMDRDRGRIDLMLVVGTSAQVFPAAGFIHAARVEGARIAVFNTERPSDEEDMTKLRDEDWFFEGDAAVVIPEVLKEVIGTVPAVGK